MGLTLFGQEVVAGTIDTYDVAKDREQLSKKVLNDDKKWVTVIQDGDRVGIKLNWSGQKVLFEGNLNATGKTREDILTAISQSVLGGQMDKEIRAHRDKKKTVE